MYYLCREGKIENENQAKYKEILQPVLSTCYNHFIPIIAGVGKRGAC